MAQRNMRLNLFDWCSVLPNECIIKSTTWINVKNDNYFIIKIDVLKQRLIIFRSKHGSEVNNEKIGVLYNKWQLKLFQHCLMQSRLNTMILKNNLQYYCIIPTREITCTNDSSTKIISSSIHIFQITLRNYFRNFEFLVENAQYFLFQGML